MAAYSNLQYLTDETPVQMNVVRKINAIALIKEVEKNPILYNNMHSSHTHFTSEMKKKTWESIAAKLCGDYWDSCDEAQKESIAKEFQFKWKNLKDNFNRILKKEKEDEENGVNVPPNKKKKYVYYDALKFLKPFAPWTKRNSDMKEDVELGGGKNASNIIFINETQESEEDTLLLDTPPTVTPIAPKSIKVSPSITAMPSFGTLQPVQFIQLHQPNVPITKTEKDDAEESATTKLSKVVEQMIQVQEEEKNDDPMGNKKFLMSLVPFMKKLPDDVNLEVRLQLMAVLQSYGAKESF